LELWHILLPLGLGLVAIYWMLPGVRRLSPLAGGLVGAVAILAAGKYLIRAEVLTVDLLLFYIFSALAIVAAGLMITLKNPVHAALAFAVVVLSSCGLFLLQAGAFLMAATIIVYAGAIIVTFLFVIMLAQQKGSDDADARSREPFLSSLAGFVLLGTLLYVLQLNYDASRFDDVSRRLRQAQQAETPEQIKDTLEAGYGAGDGFFNTLRKLQISTAGANPPVLLNSKIDISDFEFKWMEAEGNAAAMHKVLRGLQAEVQEVREQTGSLQAAEHRPLSAFSGPPPNQPVPRDDAGHARMPAANVAGLGRSLFSDYLIAVQLAATLLLVAVVGAIVITFRRPEARA
jgi:NADH:ubiquinone oxidoreductase subunit 6 (subunit J)